MSLRCSLYGNIDLGFREPGSIPRQATDSRAAPRRAAPKVSRVLFGAFETEKAECCGLIPFKAVQANPDKVVG